MPNKSTKSPGFTDEERAAMKEHILEQKAAAKGLDGEKAILAKIATMPEPDRSMAKKIHTIVRTNAPNLIPRLWYGMPAYSNKAEKVVCFFQAASKFGARYATFGFNDPAKLDDGAFWPTAFAVSELTTSAESKIAELVKKAAK